MVDFGNIIVFLSALIPALYTSRQPAPTNDEFLHRFCYSLIWGLAIALVGAYACDQPLLLELVPWFADRGIALRGWHYLLLLFAVYFLLHFIFDVVTQHVSHPRVRRVFVSIVILLAVMVAMHALFLKNIHPISATA